MRTSILAATLLVAACSTAPRSEPVASLFADHRFPPPAEPIDVAAIFAVSDAMRAFAEQRMAPRISANGPQAGLIGALREYLQVDADLAASTGVAARTFEDRSGNCLSLVILTAVFAREFAIPFQYQEVYSDGSWSRAEGLAFHSGHVNLRLGPSGMESWLRRSPELVQTVDFLKPADAARQRVRPIPEARVVAMFLNNRAAEAMLDGDLASAYWAVRAALQADPGFDAAYNTLGVVYRRHGDLPEAERALRSAVARSPANPGVLANFATVLELQGFLRAAEQVRRRARAIEPYPPFYFYDEGLAALRRGDLEAARRLLEREVERMPYDDQLHFTLGLVELRLGNVGAARQHVASALENSVGAERRNIYASKLQRLDSRVN